LPVTRPLSRIGHAKFQLDATRLIIQGLPSASTSLGLLAVTQLTDLSD